MESQTICRFCGAPGLFSKKSNSYRDYCESCKGRHIKEKREQTMLEKYGVKNPSELPSRKEVMKRINAERKKKFASGELEPWMKGKTKENDSRVREIAEKISRVKKQKFASGELVPWNKGLTKETNEIVKSIGEKVSKRKRENPLTEKEKEHLLDLIEGNQGVLHTQERKEKTKKTNKERYGVESYLSLAFEKGLRSIYEKFGGCFPSSEEFQKRKNEIFEKMRATNREKYGYDYAIQDKEVFQKIIETKRKRNTFKSSRIESEVLELLQFKRKEVWVQYKSKEYPYHCDFYLPKDDLYIELNFHWTHGSRPFDKQSKEDLKLLEILKEKSKDSDFYKNAIETWTVRDVEKKKCLENYHLNYKILYNLEEFEKFYDSLKRDEFGFIERELEYQYDELKIKEEFFSFQRKNLSYNTNKKCTNLVLPFIWDLFYQHELSKWRDSSTREDLIQNRCSYLHKLEEDITDNELLSGFSKSMIHKGFSSFSPYVIKSFINEYGVSSIYDPCGGWGQRLLGSWDIDYWYNDFNSELVKRIQELYQFYDKIHEKKGSIDFSCKDSASFIPSRSFDAVFTCPPYHSTEDYNFDGDSSRIEDFDEWLNVWWRNTVLNCKRVAPIFAYVISEKYSEKMNEILMEEGFTPLGKHLVSSGRRNHINKSAVEFLYAFKSSK